MRKLLERIVGLGAALTLSVAAAATDLKSANFTMIGMEDIPSLKFSYQVICTAEIGCMALLENGGDSLLKFTLKRSGKLINEVEETLVWVKQHGYPARQDKVYVQFDGQKVSDCWDTGEYKGVGGLCRFETPNGNETWVVLWGDMCSASCLSGFAPILVKPNWAHEKQ